MIPRYELRAVRLNGEVYPALVDHNDKDGRPFIFYVKNKPGYKEFVKLFAEYGRGAHLQMGIPVDYVLDLPHYVSEEIVNRILKANKESKK